MKQKIKVKLNNNVNRFGVCNACGTEFNYQESGRKYYCSDKCYQTPIFQSFCKYCKDEILISGEELRRRRGILPSVCLKEECLQKAKEERYSKSDFVSMYQKSKKQKACAKCNTAFSGGNLELYCENCKYELTHRACECCGEIFEIRPDSKRKVCDNCVIGDPMKYIGYCEGSQYEHCSLKEECSRYFYYNSNGPNRFNQHICQMVGRCQHRLKPIYCQECSPREKVQLYNSLKDKIIEKNENLALLEINKEQQSDKIKSNTQRIYKKICKTCGRDFRSLGPTTSWCGHCYYILECQGCGLKFATTNNKSLVCSKECSGIYFHKQGFGTNGCIGNLKDTITVSLKRINIEPYTKITPDNLDLFDGVAGVWFKTNSNNQLLDVCLTTNIKGEVKYHYWAIKNKPNFKYNELARIAEKENEKGQDLGLYFLCSVSSWEEGLRKEFDFATENGARFWSPAPGPQATWFKNFNANTVKNNEFINENSS